MKALALATLVIACAPRSPVESRDRAAGVRDVPVRTAPGDAAAIGSPVPVPAPVATVTLSEPHLSPSPAIAAAPDGITVVAATDDGRSAVTSDGRATLRLWPTLDGTREPVIVRVTVAPAQLAIVRDTPDVVIAAVDRAGQLEILRASELGALASRVRLDLGQPIVALVPAAFGFVLLRDDQTLVAVARDAHVIGTLTPNAGERVASLAARRGRVLAMIATERDAHARWVTAGDTLAFGDSSPAMAIDPAQVALAPSGTQIAAYARSHKGLAILDLASGKVATWVVPLSDEVRVNPFLRGFIDDATLLHGADHEPVVWWHDGAIESDLDASQPAAVGGCDHQIVVAGGGGLLLATPAGRKWLGYQYSAVNSVARAGNGWLVADGGSVLRIDDRFRARKTFELPTGRGAYRGIIALDATHMIAQSDGAIYQVDLTNDEYTQLGTGWSIQYEPTTGVIAFESSRGNTMLALRDPKTGTFDEPSQVGSAGRSHVLKLLDPAVAGGKVAVLVEDTVDDALEITDVRIKLRDGGRELAYKTRPHARDPNTNVFDPDIIGRLGYPATVLRTNRDRSLVAEIGAQRITLRDAAGNVRWSVAQPGASDVAWSSLGELVVFGSGIARIDLETGALLDRQCGWRFGLTDVSRQSAAAGARLCDAP